MLEISALTTVRYEHGEIDFHTKPTEFKTCWCIYIKLRCYHENVKVIDLLGHSSLILVKAVDLIFPLEESGSVRIVLHLATPSRVVHLHVCCLQVGGWMMHNLGDYKHWSAFLAVESARVRHTVRGWQQHAVSATPVQLGIDYWRVKQEATNWKMDPILNNNSIYIKVNQIPTTNYVLDQRNTVEQGRRVCSFIRCMENGTIARQLGLDGAIHA